MRAVAVLSFVVACAAAQPSLRTGPGDAPYELADDLDLAEQVDALWATPLADRGPVRAPLVAAELERAAVQLRAGRYHLAHEGLLDAAELWQGDTDAMAEGLAPHRQLLDEMARAFRRAGTDGEVVTSQVLRDLAYGIDGPSPDLEEVFAFFDYLGTVERGPTGQYMKELGAVAPIVARAAPRWLVDRYVAILGKRQKMVSELIASDGASYDLVSAHADVLVTAQAIGRTLALAGRADEIAAAVAELKGIGADRDLALAAITVGTVGDEASWLKLASSMRDVRARQVDPAAAHAVCLAALARFPDSAALHAAAGGYAQARGRVQEALAHLRVAHAGAPSDRDVADQLTVVYRERARQLAYGGRGDAVANLLDEIDAFYGSLARFGKTSWSASHGAILTAVGRGTLAHGGLDRARQLFERALEREPSSEAYESLGTIALKRGRASEAARLFDKALAQPAKAPREQWDRARVLRLHGEAALAAGDRAAAEASFREALAAWSDLEKRLELSPAQNGERLVEVGRVHLGLGDLPHAVESFEAAVDADRHGGDTHIQVVAALLLAGRPSDALDAFHRGLGSDRISDYYKVYMSLWMVADARRRHVRPNPLALDFLRDQEGSLWHQRLAAWATGRHSGSELAARATTPGKRAELAFYRAVLTPRLAPAKAKALLDEVIASNLILHFEYDLAKAWR